jgi:hypothetical protein
MMRKIQFAAVVTCMLLVPSILLACPVCYGTPNSPMTKSSNNAIVFLLGVVGFVQIGFIALFWSFWRRAKELRRRRESFAVVDGGTAR